MKQLISLILCILMLAVVANAFAESKPSPNMYIVLVNKDNKLPDGWSEMIVLSHATNSLGEDFLVEAVALEHFNALREELLEKGIQIELDSTYRSLDEQQEIWDEWLIDPEKGPEYCEQYLAKVGYSEHHTGLAIDVFIIKPDGYVERENDEMIADAETFATAHEVLAKYGFILRYPQGKEEITGYSYEPWHFRFVGESVAKEISERNLTLEEYLEQQK